MSEELFIKPVYIEPGAHESHPRATWLTWIDYYVFNLLRKPKVWVKKRELIGIASGLVHALDVEVMPVLSAKRLYCSGCRDAWLALQGQVFTSIIRLILSRMTCDEHPTVFAEFLRVHAPEFERSEDISAWINGFKR